MTHKKATSAPERRVEPDLGASDVTICVAVSKQNQNSIIVIRHTKGDIYGDTALVSVSSVRVNKWVPVDAMHQMKGTNMRKQKTIGFLWLDTENNQSVGESNMLTVSQMFSTRMRLLP